MKSIFITILLLTSITYSQTIQHDGHRAAVPFGAFSYANYLYVTVRNDCNKLDASLAVDDLCNKNRSTRNFARSCKVNLNLVSTLMFCPAAMIFPPKVFVFDLANENIAPEADELIIRNGDYSIRVDLNR